MDSKEEWLSRFNSRILYLSKQRPFVTRIDNVAVFAFDLGERIKYDESGIAIDLGPIGLKEKDGLVGMGGLYYNPAFFGSRNNKELYESWEWFIKHIEVDSYEFSAALEAATVVGLLVSQIEEGLLTDFFALLIDLHELDSLGVNVTSKIREVGKQVRSHNRKYKRLIRKDVVQAILTINELKHFLADISSEAALAKFAKINRMDVILGVKPDLIIDGKKFEVKRINKPLYDLEPADLTNAIRRGLEQGGEVIAIEDTTLKQRKLRQFKATWLGTSNLLSALYCAINFGVNGKVVLLFCGTNQGFFGRILILK